MTKTTTLLSALLIAGLIGCGNGNNAAEIDTALHQSYGALTEADEEPDFGDAELAGDEDLNDSSDVAVDDSVAAGDPDIEAAEADGVERPVRLQIAVMWGHLRPQPEVTEFTDWSGAIAIRNGALRVLRTLAFEPGDRLLPRPGPRVVPFSSKTAPHADGLLLEVILHPRLITAPGEPVVLAMDTAAFSDTLTIERGMRLSRVVPVDATGNAVAYHIFRRDADGCQEGLLAGRYTELHETADGRLLGELKGKYLSYDGQVAGKIKGIYGERDNGAQVLFAKVIGRDGAFKGTLAGRYGEGRFKGRYLTTEHVVGGAVQGLYREARAEDGGGFFMGRWSLNCAELSSEGQAEQSDEDNTVVDSEVTGE